MSSKRLRLLLIGLVVLAACAPASPPSSLAQSQPGVVHVTMWDTDDGHKVYVYDMPDGVRCYSTHVEISCVGSPGYNASVQ